MTAENPADVIEQAARVALDAMETKQRADKEAVRAALGDLAVDLDGKEHDYRVEAWEVARALHDAGLLADPAFRSADEFNAVVNEAIRHKRRANDAIARAERAEAEVAELRQKWLTFTSALGFGNNRTEPAAELSEMIDPIEQAFSDARDHQECAVICELCGDPLASKTCDECHGSGCLPNSALAYLECGTCAGVGKIHEGCIEKSYTDLVAEVADLRQKLSDCELLLTDLGKTHTRVSGERDELRATIDRVREIHQQHACTGYPDCMILFGGQCAHHGHCNHCRKTWPCPTIRALDGEGEQHE